MTGSSPISAPIGAPRVARYLARNYSSLYTAVGLEFNLSHNRVMDTVAAAALWRDARLLDSQARIVLMHLRCHFQSRITGPFEKCTH